MNITTEKATKEDINTILNFMQDYYIIEKKEMKKEKSQKAIIGLLNHESIGALQMIK